MSRTIPTDQPLTPEDRRYLEERGQYATIRNIDDTHGGEAATDPESEDGLAVRIAELEAELSDLRGRHTQLRIAREQEEANVRDNTVVDGQGGAEPPDDGLDDKSKTDLIAEVERINDEEAEEGEELSTAGTKAQLIERIRAWRADADDEGDED